ncbi:MAG: DUF3185 family protein [Chlamydiota bacterium]
MKILGIILFVAGALLLVFGINSTDKLSEKLVETTTGRYTDETMWYLIGGVILAVGGITVFVARKK